MKHTKKIIGLGLILFVSISLLQTQTSFSQEEENPYEAQCGEDACCSTYHSAMDTAKEVWAGHLSQIVDQEEPASKMVGEGFESLRTLNCWMEYTCKAVLYSAVSNPENTQGTGITSAHIDRIPGCQAPEDLSFETGWAAFVDRLKTGDPLLDDLIQPNQLNFIPACMTDTITNNADANLNRAQFWYQSCLDLVTQTMGCDTASESCTSQSSAFVALESTLRQANGRQKADALEQKLTHILNNLSGMQSAAHSVKEDLGKLDSLYSCRPGQCT